MGKMLKFREDRALTVDLQQGEIIQGKGTLTVDLRQGEIRFDT